MRQNAPRQLTLNGQQFPDLIGGNALLASSIPGVVGQSNAGLQEQWIEKLVAELLVAGPQGARFIPPQR